MEDVTDFMRMRRTATEQKRLTEELRTRAERMEMEMFQRAQDVQEANHRIEATNLELVALNKELEAFSYSVSHDLRAPLRSIDGFSQVLMEDHAAQLPPEAQGYLHRVRAATQRMSVLIDDLLNLSRVSQGAHAHRKGAAQRTGRCHRGRTAAKQSLHGSWTSGSSPD